MERFRVARNVAIVIAIGAAVYFVPGGGNAAAGFRALLYLLFGVAIAFIGLRVYRPQNPKTPKPQNPNNGVNNIIYEILSN